MKDYIMNRESLKRHCEETCKKFKDVPMSGTYGEHRLVLDLLEQTRWIPISERLPEEDGEYLLYGKITEDEENYIFVGEYDSCCEQFGIWQEQFDRTSLGYLGSEFFEYSSVLAWMPLPKPYKTEGDDV